MNDERKDAQQPVPFPWDYFALAYAFSWAFWGMAYLFAGDQPPVTGTAEDLLAAAPPAMLVLVLLGVFGPFFAAFVLTWRRQGRSGAAALWKSGWRVRIGMKWFLVALLIYPAIRLVSLLAGGAGVSFEAFTPALSFLGLAVFHYFLGGPFGEEFGWRGYALPRLLNRSNALTASLVIGFFWVCWHLPLFIIPGSPQSQIPFWPWAISVFAMAIIITWVHVNVGGVVFAAILVHTMANFSTNLFQPVRETTSGWTSPEGLGVIILVVVALAVILVWGPKRLRRE